MIAAPAKSGVASASPSATEDALIGLGRLLRDAEYRFVTVTPESHRRANARAATASALDTPASLRDVFGWSRPFDRDTFSPRAVELLAEAGAIVPCGDHFRSAVRFSTLGPDLFVHSAYPTHEQDAVFFGPDTYRFCAAIGRLRRAARRVVDIGCGTGAGGIVAKRSGAERVVLADVNRGALSFARVNAALAGIDAEIVESDVLAGVAGAFDLVLSNPPYLLDAEHRTYRDGGGAFGEGLALRIARESLTRLEPGGTLVLYTGTAVVAGDDVFLRAVTPILETAGATFRYEEIDPDVFGEELAQPAYAAVERIAAVVLVATSSGS